MNEKFYYLAEKYYGTRELSKLTPFQLDKLTKWVTNHSPDRGKTQDRKANKKYSKNRYNKGKAKGKYTKEKF